MNFDFFYNNVLCIGTGECKLTISHNRHLYFVSNFLSSINFDDDQLSDSIIIKERSALSNKRILFS